MPDASADLENKIRAIKLEPQSKKQAIANIKQLKRDLGLEGIKNDKGRIRAILKKSGSLTKELLAMREQERQ
jgi:hypothetical protein